MGGGESDDLSGASVRALSSTPRLRRNINPLDPKFALDELDSSWSILGHPEKARVAKTDTLANSMAIRCELDDTSRPANLEPGDKLRRAGLSAATIRFRIRVDHVGCFFRRHID